MSNLFIKERKDIQPGDKIFYSPLEYSELITLSGELTDHIIPVEVISNTPDPQYSRQSGYRIIVCKREDGKIINVKREGYFYPSVESFLKVSIAKQLAAIEQAIKNGNKINANYKKYLANYESEIETLESDLLRYEQAVKKTKASLKKLEKQKCSM